MENSSAWGRGERLERVCGGCRTASARISRIGRGAAAGDAERPWAGARGARVARGDRATAEGADRAADDAKWLDHGGAGTDAHRPAGGAVSGHPSPWQRDCIIGPGAMERIIGRRRATSSEARAAGGAEGLKVMSGRRSVVHRRSSGVAAQDSAVRAHTELGIWASGCLLHFICAWGECFNLERSEIGIL